MIAKRRIFELKIHQKFACLYSILPDPLVGFKGAASRRDGGMECEGREDRS